MCPLCSGVDAKNTQTFWALPGECIQFTQRCLIACHLHCLGQLQLTNTVILGPADRFCCHLCYRMLLQTVGGIYSGVCPDKTCLLHQTWNVCSGKTQNLFSTKSMFIFVAKHSKERRSTKALFPHLQKYTTLDKNIPNILFADCTCMFLCFFWNLCHPHCQPPVESIFSRS